MSMGVEVMVKPQSFLLALVVGAAILMGASAVPAQNSGVQVTESEPLILAQGHGDRMRPRSARNFGEVVNRYGKIDENILLGGRIVTVDAEVNGDVVTFARTVTIGEQIAEDVLAAGRDIVVRGAVDGDVRVAGATIKAEAQIGGDLMAAGHTITVPGETAIGGDVWVAGHDAELLGDIGGNVRAAARNIRLAGDVAGDVDVAGETVVVTSSARIAGDFTYRGDVEAVIEPGAEIQGDVVFDRTRRPREMVGSALAGLGALGLTFFLGLFLLGALHILVFPEMAAGPARRIGREPLRALGMGVLVLVGCPVAIVLFTISIIGIPVTIVLTASYVAALFIGLLVGAGALGRLGARLIGRDADLSYWTRLASFAAGLFVLIVIGLIPGLGPLVLILATAAGLGALVLQFRSANRLAAD